MMIGDHLTQAGEQLLDAVPGLLGIGTDCSAVLLAARIGASNVTTVEIDPVLAGRACAALHATDLPVRVVTGDGIHGHSDGTLYETRNRHHRPGR